MVIKNLVDVNNKPTVNDLFITNRNTLFVLIFL